MPLGAYKYDNGTDHSTGFNYWGSANTFASDMSISINVIMRSVLLRAYGGAGFTAKPVVYLAGAKVAEGAYVNFSGMAAGDLLELPLSAPYNLIANTQYRIGAYVSTGGANPALVPWVSSHTHAPTPALGLVTVHSPLYVVTTGSGGDVHPTVSQNYELRGGFSFDNPNTAPTAPTSVAASGAVDLSTTLSWVHNDAQGDPAAEYQIRYRKKDV